MEPERLDAHLLERSELEEHAPGNSHERKRTSSNLASFEVKDPDILRATLVTTCLSCGGQVLLDKSPLVPPGVTALAGPVAVGTAANRTPMEAAFGCVHSCLRHRSCKMGGLVDLNTGDEWYQKSFPVTHIDDFWSHSWHANSFQKVTALLIHYNGAPAALCGTMAGVCMMVLFYVLHNHLGCDTPDHDCDLGFLAAKKKYAGTKKDKPEVWFSIWSEVAALIVFMLVLCFYPRHRTVFLDKICIHQTDPERKLEGVQGIGFFLAKSAHMILLWDPTYLERLWCTFEMAAFSYKKNKDTKSLHVRPVLWGQVVIVEMLIVWAIGILDWGALRQYGIGQLAPNRHLIIGEPKSRQAALTLRGLVSMHSLMFMVAIHWFRVYHRGLGKLKVQLDTFTVQQAKCFCCSVEHRDPQTGARLPCDKEAVTDCIIEWFGGVTEFETYVQKDLRDHFWRQFGGPLGTGFPMHLCWLSAMPRVWAHMDKASAYWASGNTPDAGYYLVQGCFFAVFVYPLILQCLAYVGQRTYSKVVCEKLGRSASWVLDIGKSVLIGLPGIGIILLGYECLAYLHQLRGH